MLRNIVQSLIVLLFFIQSIKAQINVPENPLANLQKYHPRLLLKSFDEFDDLNKKALTDEFIMDCRKNILLNADSILSAPVCKYEIPDGLRLLTMSRLVLNRTYVLSMAYRLTKNKKYAERLWKDLLSASQFPDWNPYHFLDDAEMTHAFAIGYDWLFDVWNTDQKKVIKQAILDKGLSRGLLYYDKLVPDKGMIVNFPLSNSNWNSVCNAGMSMGALAIADEEPLVASKIIKNALKSIPLALEAFAPDGGFAEGPGYWSYSMKYNVALMASLESALGTDFGLSEMPGLSVTGNFVLAMSGATGYPYTYADAWLEKVDNPVLFWLSKKYNNPLYFSYLKSVSTKSVLDMIWYNPHSQQNSIPLDNSFSKINVASLRSAWNDKNAWFVGIKGGYNQDNHSHLDLGSFILERNDIRWFTDFGAESYNVPSYFDKNKTRWTYYRVRAEGHNTLVINPDQNPDQNLFGRAPITFFKSENNKSFAILDLKDAYTGKVLSAQRGFALINKNHVVIQDEIRTEKPSELFWFAHTPAIISLSKNGKSATLKKDGKFLKVELISPANAKFEIMEPKLLPSSIQSEGNDKNAGFKKLSIHLTNVIEATITVAISDKGGSKNKVVVKPLSKW
ncbi:hypothetical protein A5893_02430 [Pedobacter psychrophilus]|uniref:Uncharacterized protein n=1 Tax=Pedobacter psychrophilus TaxID=1826909 RepID=A0A179DLQ1_9SPHI|nr:heparinase II/III family protein [Pedobacter psychrophilus]OAQ41997.1 hypothetical protein A5893_02430 [Pedobacter psychrophilus]